MPEFASEDALAFDKGSVRTIDVDGRMHVEITPISKAGVNGYRGNEVPNGQALGLDPFKIYMLFRSPAELEKAASSFNNVPLLDKHVRTTAAEPKKDAIVGSVGSTCKFQAPYLKNSLAIWDAVAIAGVVTEEQCQLSSSYHYKAVMTPGEYKGEKYDGVMTGIVGNHVALVPKGRAGPDVVVGDSALSTQEEFYMANPAVALSRKALFASGALRAYFLPKLANDAAIDLNPALLNVTAENWDAKQDDIIKSISEIVAGKLAQDADVDGVKELLKTVGKSDTGPEAKPEADPVTGDSCDLSFLEGKICPEDMSKLCELMGVKKNNPTGSQLQAHDETDEQKAALEAAAKKEGSMPDAITKQAMDAAIEESTNKAVTDTMARMNAIRDAERVVRPYVGELAMAFDSADSVYKVALDQAGIDLTGVHPTAYAAMVRMLPKPGAKPAGGAPLVAMDAASVKTFNERFPNAARIGSV